MPSTTLASALPYTLPSLYLKTAEPSQVRTVWIQNLAAASTSHEPPPAKLWLSAHTAFSTSSSMRTGRDKLRQLSPSPRILHIDVTLKRGACFKWLHVHMFWNFQSLKGPVEPALHAKLMSKLTLVRGYLYSVSSCLRRAIQIPSSTGKRFINGICCSQLQVTSTVYMKQKKHVTIEQRTEQICMKSQVSLDSSRMEQIWIHCSFSFDLMKSTIRQLFITSCQA